MFGTGEIDLSDFQSLYHDLCRRSFDPYPQCSKVCTHAPCLYRFQLALLVQQSWLHRRYMDAFTQIHAGTSDTPKIMETLRDTAQTAVRRTLSEVVSRNARQCAAACFLIQKAYAWPEADEEQRHKAAQLGVKSALGDAPVN